MARVAGRISSDHYILTRRKEEETRRFYQDVTKTNFDRHFAAHWEHRTADDIEKKQTKKRYQFVLEDDRRNLDDRRRRMADMLAREQEDFQRQLEALEETPAQRRASMEARARELKAKREKERTDFVREQYERQWRMSCDALREADSLAILRNCDSARHYQIQEKMGQLELEEEENRVFDQMWEEDRQRKLQREIEEVEMRHQMDMEQKGILNSQVAELESFREQERMLAEDEAQLLRQQWEIEREESQRLEMDRVVAQRSAASELTAFNEAKKREQMHAQVSEKSADQQMLQTILSKEAQEEEREQMHRKAVREEALRYREHLKLQMQKEAENEAELEALREAELSKAWDKRLQQWAVEQHSRERLQTHVLSERERQIEEKRQRNEAVKLESRMERQQLDNKIKEISQVEQDKHREKHAGKVANKEYVTNQITAKHFGKQADKREKLLGRQEAHQVEQMYSMKLEQEIHRARNKYNNQP